jgi:gliding motility-associated lipoprotein GldB
MNKCFCAILFFLTLVSCNEKEKQSDVISNIQISVDIDRFDKKFYTSNTQSLQQLKQQYPYLFPTQNNDSIWLAKITDEKELNLFNKAQQVFSDFETEKTKLTDLFKHVKYYHSDFESPKIITLITNLDYQSRVVFADSLLFVSLDLYLGKDNEVYGEFPSYLSQNFEKNNLIIDVAGAIADYYFSVPYSRYFIEMLVNEGKKMAMIDYYLPTVQEADKLGYTKEDYQWALNNETEIWKYFIEKNYLYSTDNQLYNRFIANGPFSKFYLDIDKESPGKIGVWVGWQIVKAYLQNNNVTLLQLLQTPADEVFKNSKYKPKK